MPELKPHSLATVATIAAVTAIVSACGGDESESSVLLPVPAPIRNIAALDGAQLSLEISLNNSPPTRFFGQGANDSWRVTLNAPASASATIQITWIETYQQQRLVLAQQTHSFNTGAETTTVTVGSDYITTGTGFDFDSDTISNLAERLNNTDPLVSDSGQLVINEPEVVAVTGGCFTMGSPESEPERQASEIPHDVCVNDYSIGKFEVTFEQYDQFATLTDRPLPDDVDWGRGSLPVTNVSWFDAIAYTDWLTAQTGRQYRLPTEAEWEYAARAGTTTAFSTGATISEQQANFNASVSYNGSTPGARPSQSVPVGSYPANPWGIHDMHGNQGEWTCSTFSILYSGGELSCEDFPDNVGYAIRGGSWTDPPDRIRSAVRSRDTGDRFYFYTGFRVAVTP